MARRRKEDASERRTAGLRLQLTPAERTEIETRAATYGQTLSEFCRLVLLSDLKKPLPTPRNVEGINRLMVEISRVGNNVNQMTRIANERRDLPSLGELREVTAQIIASIEKVMTL